MNDRRATRRSTFASTRPEQSLPSGIHLEPWMLETVHEWGLPLGKVPTPFPHVSVQMDAVPEGVLVIACCNKCGGRHETVADLRQCPDTKSEADFSAMMESVEEDALLPILTSWLPEHAACDERPRVYHLPSNIQRQVNRRLSRAAKRLAAGRRFSNCIDLLCEDGRILEVPIDDLPVRTPDSGDLAQRVWVAELQFRMRERRRSTGIEFLAAMVVGEAWAAPEGERYPSQSPKRYPVVQVAVATSSMAVTGVAEIHRPGDRLGEGRGTFNRPELNMPLGRYRLLDGVLATTRAY